MSAAMASRIVGIGDEELRLVVVADQRQPPLQRGAALAVQ